MRPTNAPAGATFSEISRMAATTKQITKLTASSARTATGVINSLHATMEASVAELREHILAFDNYRGWKLMGYDSLNKWAAACLPWSQSKCYALLVEARVQSRLTAAGEPYDGNIPAEHLQVIGKAPERRQANLYQQAVDLANVDNDGETKPPTTKQVRTVVRAFTAAQPATDARGTAVSTEALNEVMEGVAGFDAVQSILLALKTQISDLAVTPAGAMLAGELDSIERHRHEMWRLIRFSRPHMECVYCKGEGTQHSGSKCRACKGRGWLTELQWKQAPKDKDMQEVRETANVEPAE